MIRFAAVLDGFTRRATRAGLALSLPLALLLFLQWPLREWVQAGSREANDLGQILFAFYAACALTYATRSGGHLAVDAVASRYAVPLRRLMRRCLALFAAAWCGWMLWLAWAPTLQSVLQRESFPESFNPGYFQLRVALLLLLLLAALQALADAALDRGDEGHPHG
jgi:TRAP-type C4-dicarboxylate transport system permease small subunit